MPVTVNINGLSCVHQTSLGMATATLPDVCKTPPYATPLPYPNVALASDLVGGTATVLVDGSPAAIQGSSFIRSTGDEAGSLGGIVSGVFAMEATFLSFSPTVSFEGQPVCRLTDKLLMNRGNTACLAGEMQACLPPAGNEPLNELPVLDCEEPRFCNVYSVAVSCGHGDRGFYHDLVAKDLPALQLISNHDKPDKLVVGWDSECGFGKSDCASLFVRSTLDGEWKRIDPRTQELALDPPFFDAKLMHWGQVIDWLIDPAQMVRRTYRLQTMICHGNPNQWVPVGIGTQLEVYPEASVSGKAWLKYAHPEVAGKKDSLQYSPEATWIFGGELKGKLGQLEKTYKPSTDPQAATALPLFGSLLHHLGKTTLIFESMQKYGLDFKGKLLPPSWEFGADAKLAEVPGQPTVSAEGSFKFGFSPLIGLEFSVSVLDYLIRFAGTLGAAAGGPLLAQALIQLKAKFASDPKNPNRASLDVDITLTTTGKIDGGFGLKFIPGQKAKLDSALAKGSIGVELKGVLKGSGKIWVVQAAAGGEVGARAAKGKDPSEISASLEPVQSARGAIGLKGKVAFNGLAVYYLLYAEVGAAGAENMKKTKGAYGGDDGEAPTEVPEAATTYRVLEKKGDCVLLNPWTWSPPSKVT